jgi:hypothetical protein
MAGWTAASTGCIAAAFGTRPAFEGITLDYNSLPASLFSTRANRGAWFM